MLIEKSVGIVNISNRQLISIKELAQFIEALVDTEVWFKFKGTGISDINVREVSNKAFFDLFPDFQFSSFELGLKKTINWYIQNFKGN